MANPGLDFPFPIWIADTTRQRDHVIVHEHKAQRIERTDIYYRVLTVDLFRPASPSPGRIEALRRLWQIHDAINPIPRVTVLTPESCEEPRLVAIVGAANRAAEQDETTVILTGAQHLPGVPWQRGAVKRHQHHPVFPTGDQERGIIQPQP